MMRGARHVARVDELININILSEHMKGKNNLGDPGIDGRIILK
jgi:hypothetical protein